MVQDHRCDVSEAEGCRRPDDQSCRQEAEALLEPPHDLWTTPTARDDPRPLRCLGFTTAAASEAVRGGFTGVHILTAEFEPLRPQMISIDFRMVCSPQDKICTHLLPLISLAAVKQIDNCCIKLLLLLGKPESV